MDMIGKKFGRLTVIEEAGRDAQQKSRLWRCRCNCDGGGEVIASTGRLNIGAVKSCGCIRREKPNGRRHGASAHSGRDYANPIWRTYVTWQHLRRRCDRPKAADYKYYGGRGITYDPRWKEFEAFLADMGPRPENTTLDRVDNDGNYCKDNCRWATQQEQVQNRDFGIAVFFNGKSQKISQWAKELGLKSATIHNRLSRGWSVERALSGGTFHKSGKFTPSDH